MHAAEHGTKTANLVYSSILQFVVGVSFTSSPIHFCVASSSIIYLWIIHNQEMNGFVLPLVLTRKWAKHAALEGTLYPNLDRLGHKALLASLCTYTAGSEFGLTLAGCTATRNGHLAATQGAPEAVWRLCLASRTKNKKKFF